jgi:purine-binding chemotaxis protein CheW
LAGTRALRAEDLAAAFDRSFAEARAPAGAATDDFLAIHVGGVPHALHLVDIAGLHHWRQPAWLPGPVAELSGIVSLRGTLMPVYDLAALLGYAAVAVPRWMAVAAAAPVAFAVESFDGHFRVARDAVDSSNDDTSGQIHQVVRTTSGPRSVIHLDTLVASVRRSLPSAAV